MRSKIIYLGQITESDANELSDFLGHFCFSEGDWGKFTRTDSSFEFAVCSNGKHFIRLAGYSITGGFYKIKEVKTYINTYGYLGVSGFSPMHQLVAEAFIPDFVPYPEKEVNHLDGDKLNNDISNLELVTHQENINHFFQDDRMLEHRQAWLANHKGRHWTEAQRTKFLSSYKYRPLSDEVKAKISKGNKGKKLSPEHIERLKEANRGNTWSRGKISVTNGVENALINPEDLSLWEAKGFKRGKRISAPKHKAPYKHTEKFLEKQRLRKLSKEVVNV